MSQVLNPPAATSGTSSWRLWIDRCGGYELVQGDRWTVGGARPSAVAGSVADVQVQTDWRRFEGELSRCSDGYVWVPSQLSSRPSSRAAFRQATASGPTETQPALVNDGDVVPISGGAHLVLHQPSMLSGSAVLSLKPPLRFANHVDAVVLVDQTVLIGRGAGNHIQSPSHDHDVVLVLRQGVWNAKIKPAAGQTARKCPLVELVNGRRVSVGEMDMTLEKV